MAENIRVFIHGRPQGQDVWSKSDLTPTEHEYIKRFLDSKTGNEVAAVVVVDTISNSSYYTYLRRKDVVENDRGSGYFAITICFPNKECVNVGKIYDLLDQIYAKKCLGTILANEGGKIRFKIKKFSDVENYNSGIAKIIEDNVNLLVLEDINGRKDTLYSNIVFYSYEDIGCPAFFKDAKNNQIAISKEYPSKTEIINRKQNELIATSANCQKKINQAEAVAEAKWKGSIDEYKVAIDNLKKEIANDQNLFANSQNQIANLTQQLSSANETITKLKSENEIVTRKNEENKIYEQIREPLAKLARLTAGRFRDDDSANNISDIQNDIRVTKKRAQKIWNLGISVFVLLVVGIIGFACYIMFNDSSTEQPKIENQPAQIQVDDNNGQDEFTLDTDSDYVVVVADEVCDDQKPLPSIPLNSFIDISGYPGNGADFKVGTTYTLPTWEGFSFKIILDPNSAKRDVNNNSFCIHDSCKLKKIEAYDKNGELISTRELNKDVK